MNGAPPCCIMCSMGAMVLSEYPIFENDNQIGNATFFQEGLYYKIHCYYKTNKKYHHLLCSGNHKSLILGTGIPYECNWELKRFIPINLLPDKPIKLILKSAQYMQKLTPGKPIVHISKIATGKLYCCEDGYWVVDSENANPL